MEQERQQIIDEAAMEAVRGILEAPEYGECYLVEVLSGLGVESTTSSIEATDVRVQEILA